MELSEYILYILQTRGVPDTTLSIVNDLFLNVGVLAVRDRAKRRKWKLGSETALRSGQKGRRILMDDWHPWRAGESEETVQGRATRSDSPRALGGGAAKWPREGRSRSHSAGPACRSGVAQRPPLAVLVGVPKSTRPLDVDRVPLGGH